MEGSRKGRKVDGSKSGVVRPLIKAKKGLGGFMVFIPAYVPSKEMWIVFSGQMILKTDLTEEQATKLAYSLNAAEWLEKTVESERVTNAGRNFDLEEIYKAFPRKIGKKLGMKRLKTSVKSTEKYVLCIEAVFRYKKYVEDNAIEEKFVKHFSTWASSWEDWIPPDTEVSSLPQMSFDDISKKQIQF